MTLTRCRTRSMLALALMLMTTGARADDVVLNQTAVMAASDVAVTLGDIARLEGPEAEALSAVVLRARAGAAWARGFCAGSSRWPSSTARASSTSMRP